MEEDNVEFVHQYKGKQPTDVTHVQMVMVVLYTYVQAVQEGLVFLTGLPIKNLTNNKTT